MRGRRRLVLAVVSAAAAVALPSVRAQDSSAARDPCTPRGRSIAAFAAREHGWAVRVASATRRLSLGRGTVWVVDENAACCPRIVRHRGTIELTGCSGRSETRSAHVGEVGTRRFALARARPTLELAAAGENMLRAPWRAGAWTAFVRAAGAAPVTDEQALVLATHVHASLWHGLGVLRDEPTAVAAVSARDRDELSRNLELSRRLGLGPIESRAIRTSDGFEVTLWSSRRVAATSALDPGGGPGAVLSEELRRVKLAIARDATIVVLELVAATSHVQRVTAR